MISVPMRIRWCPTRLAAGTLFVKSGFKTEPLAQLFPSQGSSGLSVLKA